MTILRLLIDYSKAAGESLLTFVMPKFDLPPFVLGFSGALFDNFSTDSAFLGGFLGNTLRIRCVGYVVGYGSKNGTTKR